MRRVFQWRLRTRALELGRRTRIMGVLNVTPDSFSDGGQFFIPEAAVEQALRMLDEGADIVDIGGESTRPGKKEPVTAQQELDRVLPVVEAVRRERPEALLSVDTYKGEVARAAIAAGAEIVNDVSGLKWDAAMAGALAELQCGAVLMHVRGRPEEWRTLPPLVDPVGLVMRELGEIAVAAEAAGVEAAKMVLDPGLGFGKNFDENWPLLARLEELAALGYPLLVGASRKSFIGRALASEGRDATVEERLYGSLSAAVMAVMHGAHILRVHDVRETVEAVRVAEQVVSR